MPFDPAADLAPITNLIRVPLVLVVNPSIPAKNLAELPRHPKWNRVEEGEIAPRNLIRFDIGETRGG
jgi:hypothetical protein